MKEHRIKSAMEIAMEKMASVPRLTPEEVARQKEKECRPIGEAIAGKYLESAITGAELPVQLGKYRGDEGRIVRRAFISSLCQSIEPADAARSRRALEGVLLAAGADSGFEKLRQESEEILSDFERETGQRYTTFERVERERLEKLGVSGSAIRPNLREREEWRQELGKIRQAYDLRLDRLRTRLMQLQ